MGSISRLFFPLLNTSKKHYSNHKPIPQHYSVLTRLSPPSSQDYNLKLYQKMEGQRAQRRGYLKDKATVSNLDEEEMENGMDGEEEDGGDEDKRKRMMERVRGLSTDRVPSRLCQVDRCTANLTEAKQYYRRHKVCEVHAKASAATVTGVRQRFCQQCSRFHELPEFDEAKRSCRRRLAGHNERRRKISGDSFGEGSGRRGFSGQLIQTQERNREEMRLPMTNSSFKRPQIR